MADTVFLSTSIPYVNGDPHIGHALEYIQSDALARGLRRAGYDVIFTTGTDENAMKNIESAKKAGVDTKAFVDDKSAKFEELCRKLDVTTDIFIRTTSAEHHAGASKLWSLCAHDIYKKTYTGLYCVGCEAFYEDGELPDNFCPDHKRKLEVVSEENYFFALSRYQKQIEDLLESDKLHIFPTYRKTELLNFVKKGLKDFSISRPSTRVSGWGVPVPGDDSQRMYVWYDALANYITALGFGSPRRSDSEGGSSGEDLYEKYWVNSNMRIHVVGKDIIKFHAIYWPAMLLSAGQPVPTHLYTHGFLTVDGAKMSKSIGNVIDPFAIVDEYGLDPLRYYMLRETSPYDDGDFSVNRLRQLYSAELANELGNLLSRLTTLAAADGIAVSQDPPSRTSDPFDYQKDITEAMAAVSRLNKDFNTYEPWSKSAADRQNFLREGLGILYDAALMLQTCIPASAGKILKATEGKITKAAPLFPRL